MLKNKKDILKFAAIVILIIGIILVITLYIVNENFRKLVDKYVLAKEIVEENVITIPLEESANNYVYAVENHIAILSGNILKMYNASGKEVQSLNMNISKPIFEADNKYLVVAESGGKKLYLVSGNNILWEKDVEGSISKINVNKNGYVSVVLTGTSYKVVVTTYNTEGKELFSTYLSTTYSVDIDLSDDNKYLAIAEANSSGTVIKSGIKIISIEKAQTTPSEAIIYNNQNMNNQIITKLSYQDNLVYMYESGIGSIINEEINTLSEFQEDDLFADIDLTNNIVKVTKKESNLFDMATTVEITNSSSKKTSVYTLDGVPKGIYTYGDIIALNIGTEIHFVGTNGWLIKKYVSSQEIREVVLSSNIAGIVERNKVEIISL